MRAIIKYTLISMMLLNGIAYAVTPGIYLGVHQGFGTLKYNLGKIHPVSGDSFGISGKRLRDMSTIHYQISEKWGVTTVLSSKFADFETSEVSYTASIANMILKREFFKKNWIHFYLPIGIWGGNSLAVFSKNYQIGTHGIALGGLGLQLNAKRILVDLGYKRLWSFGEMEHMGIWTLSISFNLLDLSKRSEAVDSLSST